MVFVNNFQYYSKKELLYILKNKIVHSKHKGECLKLGILYKYIHSSTKNIYAFNVSCDNIFKEISSYYLVSTEKLYRAIF